MKAGGGAAEGRGALAVYVKAQHCLILHKLLYILSQSCVCPRWGGVSARACESVTEMVQMIFFGFVFPIQKPMKTM